MSEEITEFDHILSTVKCAFDRTADKKTYLHLIYLLSKNSELTQRELSMVIGSLLDRHYLDLLNDVYLAVSPSFVVDDEIIRYIREKLSACGFEALN